MGRGREKAKQERRARDMKYNAPPVDLERLRREVVREGGQEVQEQRRSAEDEKSETRS